MCRAAAKKRESEREWRPALFPLGSVVLNDDRSRGTDELVVLVENDDGITSRPRVDDPVKDMHAFVLRGELVLERESLLPGGAIKPHSARIIDGCVAGEILRDHRETGLAAGGCSDVGHQQLPSRPVQQGRSLFVLGKR